MLPQGAPEVKLGALRYAVAQANAANANARARAVVPNRYVDNDDFYGKGRVNALRAVQ
jgi:hypothetical protein